MRTTVLFIIPNLKTGGSNSALSILYSYLKTDFSIWVFPLSTSIQSKGHYSFDESLLPCNSLIDAYHCRINDKSGITLLFVLLVKLIRRFFNLFGVSFEKILYTYYSRRLQHSLHPDTVVAFEEGYPTFFVSYFRDVKKIAWIHSNYDFYNPKGDSEQRYYCEFSDIVCVSKFTEEIFKKRYPMLLDRISCIHNLLDIDRITALANETIDDARFREGRFVLLSVGRIDPVKRFSSIPRIAFQLLNQGVDFIWYIIGPPAVSSEVERLYRDINKYDVKKNVVYLGNKPNPYPYFCHSRVLVCLSESEACPMVFNEAKVLSLPIVTTDFGSASEFIQDGFNGLIGGISKIPDMIKQLASNTELYSSIQNRLKESLCETDNRKILEQLSSLLSSC